LTRAWSCWGNIPPWAENAMLAALLWNTK
jgi:hypothetical protein